MSGGNGCRRRLASPPRDRSRSRRSQGSAYRRSLSSSQAERLVEREQELLRVREKIHRMEKELRKEQDYKQRRSSERSGSPAAGYSHEHRSRSRIKQSGGQCRRDRDAGSYDHRAKRSCSPTFSPKDLIQIIQSIKDVLPSQPSDPSIVENKKSLDHKNVVPEFNPSAKNQRIDMWLKKVNECATVYGWDEKTTVYFALQKLTGLAKAWYESLNTIMFNWTEWQEKLRDAFPAEQNYAQMLEDMLRRRSRLNEPMEVYFYEKLALLNQCEITGRRAVDCIIHGIGDRTIRSSALALRCDQPDQLLRFLLSSSKEMLGYLPPRDKNTSIVNKSNKRSDFGRSSFYCYNCKERGHPYRKCSKPIIKCELCNQIGHSTDACLQNKRNQDRESANSKIISKTMRISNLCPNSKFIKTVSVNGTPLEAFVDLGSEVTLIRQTDLANLGLSHDHVPSNMRGFGNTVVSSAGSIKLNLEIDGVTAEVTCRVVGDDLLEKPLLIGQTYSEQPHIGMFKDTNQLKFIHIGFELPAIDEVEEGLTEVGIVGHSIIYGSVSVKAEIESPFSGEVVLGTKIVGKPDNQFIVCGGIHNVKNGKLFVTIRPCSVPCWLQNNFIFSRAEKVQVVQKITNHELPLNSMRQKELDSERELDEAKVSVGSNVTNDNKTRLFEILRRHQTCFAYDMAGLGCTNVTEMKIELNSQRPVVYRPYRLSHHEREKVQTMVDEMLQAGIVRESVSNYASPIILVRKKEGGTRMCVDYRLLNSVTVKERYPMPVIEDEVARLSGQSWFTTLDLMSGYYQVPIAEESKHLTAFVTPDGQYEYNRMPFGLANAPAVFQRMMNHVLGLVRYNKATVYIDDLLIFGRNQTECLDRLEEVLVLLKKANLKLNLSKCKFLENTIEYLGLEISSEGMRPGKAKIQSVVDFPKPINVHGVRQFLGLVSYFRKFMQGFAQIAHPLTKLLKKDAVWEWTNDQEVSFKSLKAKLIDRPVLAIYDPSAETELHTDASRIGIGGILLQRSESNGPFHPVAFYSRQTTPEEKNFHSYELETLAVICSLKKFRVYLLGKSFKIITDCSALRSTFIKRDLIPRIARWWLALQEFDCSVEFRAGSKMGHVDALSRNPGIDTVTLDPEQFPCVMAISEEDWLLTLQLGDPELCRIRDIVNNDMDSKSLQYIKENYVLKNNRLFRYIGNDKESIRWVVPKGARWQLCKRNHDDIGHVGYEKTLNRIKKNYWFAKMNRFIKKYVGACIECAYAKKVTNTREGLLHPIEKVDKPFHTLHVDHLGPFVKSKRGNTHILTVVDAFTKYLFIKPVRNTNTQNVIKNLEDIFDTFRAPDRLISDRGSCFTSHAFKKFCLERGVKHILNATASPRSNGQVERYNRTVLDSLTAQNLGADERDWDSKLGRIQWGLNNTVQKTIGRSPTEVMFGTEMNSEFNAEFSPILEETREVSSLQSIRSEVKNRIDKVQATQKEYYDQGRRPARMYNNGDLVKITKVAFHNDGKSTKLLPSYEGPYRVIKTLGNDRYKVAPIAGFKGMKNKRKTTIAADRMRPWIHITSLEIDDHAEDDIDEDFV